MVAQKQVVGGVVGNRRGGMAMVVVVGLGFVVGIGAVVGNQRGIVVVAVVVFAVEIAENSAPLWVGVAALVE